MAGEQGRLSVVIEADTSLLDSSLDDAFSKVEGFGDMMGTFSANVSGGSGMPELGIQIRGAFAAGLAPLQNMQANFATAFDRMGGTVVTLARRIDNSMKQAFNERTLKAYDNTFKGLAATAVAAGTYVMAPWLGLAVVPKLASQIGGALAGAFKVPVEKAERLRQALFALGRFNGIQALQGGTQVTALPAPRGPAPTPIPPVVTASIKRMTTLARELGQVYGPTMRMVGTVSKSAGTIVMGAANMIVQSFGWIAGGTVRNLSKIKQFFGTMGDVAKKGLTKLGLSPVSGGTIASYGKLAGTITGIGPAANMASKATKSLGREIAAALGVFSGATALIAFFKTGVTGAMNLNETISKVDVVFGTATDDVKANADRMAKSFGAPKQAVLDATAAFGLVGKASGQSQGQAANLGISMTKLAADTASFYNIPMDSALEKLRSGLVGEAEPMRALGVLLSDDAVKAEAMRLGLTKTTKTISEGAKVQARASLITRGLSDAQGDLERTSNSSANMLKRLQGDAGNLATTFGQSFLGAFDTVLSGLGGFMSGISSWVTSNTAALDSVGAYFSDFFVSVGAGITDFTGAIGDFAGEIAASFGGTVGGALTGLQDKATGVMDGIGFAVRNAGSLFTIMWIKFKEMGLNIGEVLGAWMGNMDVVGQYMSKNWTALIFDATNYVATIFTNLGTNIWELGKSIVKWLQDPTQGFTFNFTSLTDGFKATAEALPDILKPALTSLQGDIDAVTTKMGDKEVARANAIAAKKALPKAEPAKRGVLQPTDLEKKEEKDKAVKFAGALSINSKEARTSILSAQGGGKGGGPEKETAKNTAAAAREAKETNTHLKNLNTAVSRGNTVESLR